MVSRSYAILGTGALGGLYGGLLAKSGVDVHFLLHSDYDHVRNYGLRVESRWGDFHLTQVQAYNSVLTMPQVDVVIVAWKTIANHLLADTLPPLMKPDSVVLVLQNGWDIESEAAAIVGAERVLGGCCFLCSNKVGPGHIHHLDFGRIVFGEYSPKFTGTITDRAAEIAEDFTAAGIEISAAPDLRVVRWRKLMWNIPFNGLAVVLDSTTDLLMADPQASRLCEELMREVRGAAGAHGHDIEESFVVKLLDDTRRMVPYASSMLVDYRLGKPMEVEAIVGNPLRAAERLEYATPKLAMLYRMLSYLNSSVARQRHQARVRESSSQ